MDQEDEHSADLKSEELKVKQEEFDIDDIKLEEDHVEVKLEVEEDVNINCEEKNDNDFSDSGEDFEDKSNPSFGDVEAEKNDEHLAYPLPQDKRNFKLILPKPYNGKIKTSDHHMTKPSKVFVEKQKIIFKAKTLEKVHKKTAIIENNQIKIVGVRHVPPGKIAISSNPKSFITSPTVGSTKVIQQVISTPGISTSTTLNLQQQQQHLQTSVVSPTVVNLQQPSPKLIVTSATSINLTQQQQLVQPKIVRLSTPANFQQQQQIIPQASNQIIQAVPSTNSSTLTLSDPGYSVVYEKQSFACHQCDFKAQWLHDLNHHVKKVHQKYIKYCCEKCDYSTKFSAVLARHMREKHPVKRNYSLLAIAPKSGKKVPIPKL